MFVVNLGIKKKCDLKKIFLKTEKNSRNQKVLKNLEMEFAVNVFK